MNYRESDSRIVSKISIIIRLKERRRLHNIALNKETLTIHRDRRNSENEIIKNSRNIYQLAKPCICNNSR